MHWLRVACLGLLMTNSSVLSRPDEARTPTPASYADVTEALGLRFRYQSSHTSHKYLIETMGAGVALADFDDDGRLDAFLSMALRSKTQRRSARFPRRAVPTTGIVSIVRRRTVTFEDATERAGLQGVGYGMGVAVGDYDNDGREDLRDRVRRQSPLSQRGRSSLCRCDGRGRHRPAAAGPRAPPGSTWTPTGSSI